MSKATLQGGSNGTGTIETDPGMRARSTGIITISARPAAVVIPLLAILLAMTAIVVTLPVLAQMAGRNPQDALFRIIDFRQEANIPTLFSSGILAFACVLLAVTGRDAVIRERNLWMAGRWYGLAVIFAFLSLDETAMIHEGFNKYPLGSAGALAIVDKFPWVWFYGAAVVALGLFYLPFLLRLPRLTAILFVMSGIIYVGGAIGLEVFGAYELDVDHIQRASLDYILRGVAEEFCEMAGTLLFLWALLRHLARRGTRIALDFGSVEPRAGELP